MINFAMCILTQLKKIFLKHLRWFLLAARIENSYLSVDIAQIYILVPLSWMLESFIQLKAWHLYLDF